MTEAGLKPQIDPAFNFSVTIDGLVTLGEFMEVSSITQSIDVLEYDEAGTPYPRAFIGPLKQERVVLKWGMVNSSVFSDWLVKVKYGMKFRYNVTIYHYARGPVGSATQPPPPLRTYLLRGAFPSRWSTPGMNSMSAEVPMEELELIYNYMTVTVTPPASV